MATSKPWADSPWPLLETPSKSKDTSSHAALFVADDMAQVHNVLLRGLNAIYNQAPGVEPGKDARDFLFFIHCYCDLVELHHLSEERFLFPEIAKLAQKPDLLASSSEQHRSFSDGIEKLHSYASQTAAEQFNGKTVQEIVSEFGPKLREHLSDEIQELESLTYLDSATLMDIWKRSEKYKTPAKANEMFPLYFGLVDADYEGGIHHHPRVPFFVYYLVHYWFAWKHAGSWRFLPCTFWGKRQELPFA